MKNNLFVSAVIMFMLLPITNAMAAGNVPEGNYLETCRQCQFGLNNQLSCICKNKHQREVATSSFIEPQCTYIENIDGYLRCTEWDVNYEQEYNPLASDIRTGPIWSQRDAENKCPRVCNYNNGQWTGAWTTVVPGRMSVCKCDLMVR